MEWCVVDDKKLRAEDKIFSKRTDDVNVSEARQGQVLQEFAAQSTRTHNKNFAVSIKTPEEFGAGNVISICKLSSLVSKW